MFPGGPDTMPDEMVLPQPPRPRETQQDLHLREIEIDPASTYQMMSIAIPSLRYLGSSRQTCDPPQALRDKEEST